MGRRGRFNAHVLALAAVVAAALVPPAAQAGGVCAPAAVSYSSYSAYPAASYSYSTAAYVAPVKTVYEKVYVPQVVKVYQNPDFYSSTESYYQSKMIVDAVAGKTAEALKLQEELSQLRQQVQTYQQLQMQWQLQQQQQQQQQYQPPPPAYQQPPPQHYPPQAPQQPPYAPQRSPVPQRMPPAYGQGGGYHGGPPQQTQGNVPAGLDQVVANSCIRCHGGGSGHQGGGLDLRDLANVPWETRLLCHSEVCNGTMPRGGQALSAEQTALFYEWAQAGRGTVARR